MHKGVVASTVCGIIGLVSSAFAIPFVGTDGTVLTANKNGVVVLKMSELEEMDFGVYGDTARRFNYTARLTSLERANAPATSFQHTGEDSPYTLTIHNANVRGTLPSVANGSFAVSGPLRMFSSDLQFGGEGKYRFTLRDNKTKTVSHTIFRIIDDRPEHPVPTPEPGTMLLLGTGLLSAAGYGWRRRKAAPTV